MMSFPEPAAAGASEFRLAFKYFRRVEGIFRVNPKAKAPAKASARGTSRIDVIGFLSLCEFCGDDQ